MEGYRCCTHFERTWETIKLNSGYTQRMMEEAIVLRIHEEELTKIKNDILISLLKEKYKSLSDEHINELTSE